MKPATGAGARESEAGRGFCVARVQSRTSSWTRRAASAGAGGGATAVLEKALVEPGRGGTGRLLYQLEYMARWRSPNPTFDRDIGFAAAAQV